MKRTLLTLFVMTLTGTIVIGANAGAPAKTIRIGMAASFVEGRSKAIISIAADDFNKVMTATTGFNGQFTAKLDAFQIARKLDEKQLDFGIFHAHEFAWVQAKHSDLDTLLVAANKNHVERAFVIVHLKNPAKSLADLRGKKADLPVGTNEPCRLYLRKLCGGNAKTDLTTFFGAIQKSGSPADGLDEVARGNAQVTVVDSVFLDFYKEVKGAVFAKNLRVLQQSDVFPPAVIVYKKGAVDPKTLKQFRDGLLKVHMSPAGRDLMKNWNVEAFEPVPASFAKSLAEIAKAYPAP